jgi:hypothetical protein
MAANPTAADIAEVESGKGSARDRAEVAQYKRTHKTSTYHETFRHQRSGRKVKRHKKRRKR